MKPESSLKPIRPMAAQMRGFSTSNEEKEGGFMSFLKVASETDKKQEHSENIEAAEIEMNLGDMDIGFEKEGNL